MPVYSLLGIDVWIPDFNDLVQAVTAPLYNVVTSVLSSISTVIWPMLQTLGTQIYSLIQPLVDRVWAVLQSIWNSLLQALLGLQTLMVSSLETMVSRVSQTVQYLTNAVWSAIKPTIDAIWSNVRATAGIIWGMLEPWYNAIMSALSGDLIPLQRLLNATVHDLALQIGFFIPEMRLTMFGLQLWTEKIEADIRGQPVTMEQIFAAKLNEVLNPLGNLAKDLWDNFSKMVIAPLVELFKGVMQTLDEWFRAFGGLMIDTIHSIAAGGPEYAVERAFGYSFLLGPLVTGINVAAQAIELLHPIKYMGIVQTVTSALDSLGITTFSSAMYGLMVAGALEQPIRQGLALRYRQNIPHRDMADTMMAQKNITEQDWARIYGLYGWPDQYIQAWYKSLWEHPSDRMIVGMVEGGEVDLDWLLEQLIMRKYRPEDAARIMRYATKKGLMDEISAIVKEVQADLDAGQIDLLEASQELASIGISGKELEFRLESMRRRLERKDIKDRIDILTNQAKQEELTVQQYEEDLRALNLRMPRIRALVEKEEARRKPKTTLPKERKRDLAIGTYQRLFIEEVLDEDKLTKYLAALDPKLPDDRLELLVLDAKIRKAKLAAAAA